MARLWNGSRATFEQQWAHLCQSHPNYLLRFFLLITVVISHCVSFAHFLHFNLGLNFSAKLAKEPEERHISCRVRWGLFACGRLHRIRVSDQDSQDLGSGTTLTQTMIALSQAIHCFHRFQSNSFDHLKTSISRIFTKSNFSSTDNSFGKPCVICHWLS